MAHELIFLSAHALIFIAASFALGLTLIVTGMLTAALVGLMMTRSLGIKATIEFLIVVTGIAIAAYSMPAQAMVAGLFCWIYLELLRSDLVKQRQSLTNQ